MKHLIYLLSLLFIAAFLFACQSGPAVLDTKHGVESSDELQGDTETASGQTEKEDLRNVSGTAGELLPVDPAVTIGKLVNGLTYYIRENKKPEKTTVLRLVVDAGSVLEEDSELGLAHFIEHMAFNGTVHFKKTDIVDYLESIGTRFGPDVNASTGFDETIYKLEIPSNNEEAVIKALQILAEWAYLIIFEDEEVDRERGIIIEEWRERSGAGMRIIEKHYPVLFKDSIYAGRLPIGKLEIIENADAEQLRGLYEKWYRPDLMALIAVGDFESGKIEEIIKTYFSRIPEKKDAPERTLFQIPDHKGTLYSIAVDPEATESRVAVYIKHDVAGSKTREDYRESIVESLYTGMLNNRLDELSKKPDPPFIRPGTWKGRFVRTREAVILTATVPEGGIERGLESLLVETRRAKEFGFTPSELKREKQDLLRRIEQLYLERENTPSYSHAGEYRRHFLEDEPIPGIAIEYEMFSTYVPEITLEEVNRLAEGWVREDNRVVLVSAPDKSGARVPGKGELKLVFEKAKQMRLTPYEDIVREEPLLAVIPDPGSVVIRESYIEGIRTTRLLLSNGAEVFLKPTDFKKDEILFEAMSPGGHSLVKNAEYIAAITAPTAVKDGGIGNFNRTELEKKLAGKVVNVTPWISEIYEGLSGSASSRDLDTMFKLIYLSFTGPRKDPETFLAYKDRLKARFENRRSDPEEVFWDTIRSTLQQNHFRARPYTVEILEEMDLDLSFRIFRERFADAGDFTFIFIGSFDIETIKPLILTYIGGLPSRGINERWQDLNIDPPAGIVRESIYMGIDPRSQVQIVFSDSFSWSYERDFNLEAMAEILEMRLREKVREEQGGTYGIWVQASTQKYPDNEYSVYIGFGCDPDRVEELTRTVFEEITWIKEGKIDDIYLTKQKEISRRSLEKALKENRYWLDGIAVALRRREDPATMTGKEDLINRLDIELIQETARSFLNTDQYIRVVLYPESEK